ALAELRRGHARHDVVRAAGRERHDQSQRLAGVFLSGRKRRPQRQYRENRFLHSAFIPDSRTSFTKPSASDLMYAVNASGDGLATISMPRSAYLSLNCGLAAIFRISAFNLARISFGVAAGATTPFQVTSS